MLLALIEQARHRGWREVSLHAQTPAIEFYLRHGFQPYGDRFWEAGIEHQSMRRMLGGPSAIDHRDTAIATIVDIIDDARRSPLALHPRPRPGPVRRTAGDGSVAPLRHRRTRQRIARAAAGCRGPATRPRAAARAGAAPSQRLPVPRSRRSGRPGLPLGVPRQRPRAAITSAPSATASTARPTCTHRAARGSCAGRSWRCGNVRDRSANTARWASESSRPIHLGAGL